MLFRKVKKFNEISVNKNLQTNIKGIAHSGDRTVAESLNLKCGTCICIIVTNRIQHKLFVQVLPVNQHQVKDNSVTLISLNTLNINIEITHCLYHTRYF